MKKLPFHQRATCPYQCYAQHDRAAGVDGECQIVAILQQKIDIIGKCGECCEASAEARDEQRTHSWCYGMCAFGGTKKQTYNKTTHDIYREGAQGKCSHDEQIAQLARQESHTGADKASQAGDKHCFNHNVKIRIFLLGNKSHAIGQKSMAQDLPQSVV